VRVYVNKKHGGKLMNTFTLKPIGKVKINESGMFICLEEDYIPALKALEGFSHINVLWWCDGFDSEEFRSIVTTQKPYKKAPDVMGIFATRSPIRPNPIAVTASQIINIDYEKGIIQLAYIDANNDTPVLDIKPYTPSGDIIRDPAVPDWCAHWPKCLEASAEIDWENEFLF
jgi:tRNA-Thr(GGU) m(6)t(6)A37 methyltransferase TsaA